MADEFQKFFRRFTADLKSRGGRRSYNVKRIAGKAEIIGVYSVRAEESCHLIEMKITDSEQPLNFRDLTQAMEGRGRSFWQSPWLECLLNADGAAVLADSNQISGKNSCFEEMLESHFSFTSWTLGSQCSHHLEKFPFPIRRRNRRDSKC